MNTALPIYFLCILQGQWSTVKVLIFVINSFQDGNIYIEFGGITHNLGAREEKLSEP